MNFSKMISSSVEYFKNPDGSKIPRIIFDPLDSSNTRYQIIEILGVGSFGKCYQVRDISNDENNEWACKVLEKANITTIKIKERLQFEVQIVQSLPKHPRIAFGHKVFQDEFRIYIIMELCNKRTMETLIRTRKRLTEFEARYFFIQIAEGIIELHRRRIIHRDIKLANILLNSKNQIKIGDFGLSAFLEKVTDRKTSFLGTLNYLSPEVVQRGKNGHSFGVDVWALGVFLYVMLVGKTPFAPKQKPAKPENYYYEICKGKIEFPNDIPISDEAKNLILNLCQKSEEKRIKSNHIKFHPWILNYRKTIPETMPDQIFNYPIHPLKWNREIETNLSMNQKMMDTSKQQTEVNDIEKNEQFKNMDLTRNTDKIGGINIEKIIKKASKVSLNHEINSVAHPKIQNNILGTRKSNIALEKPKVFTETPLSYNSSRISNGNNTMPKHVIKFNRKSAIPIGTLSAHSPKTNKKALLFDNKLKTSEDVAIKIHSSSGRIELNHSQSLTPENQLNIATPKPSYENVAKSRNANVSKQESVMAISENQYFEELAISENKKSENQHPQKTDSAKKPSLPIKKHSVSSNNIIKISDDGVADEDIAIDENSRKKPDNSSLLTVWQAKLEVLSVRFNYYLKETVQQPDNNPKEDNISEQKNRVEQPVHLIRFVRVPKYGLGYELSNGTFGVSFRDKTSLLSTKNSTAPLIVMANKSRVEIKQLPPIDEISGLKQKLALFSQFECAVKEQSMTKHFQKNPKTTSDSAATCVFVTKYLSAKNVSMYRISNGTIQVCFKDGSQLLLFEENKITFTDKSVVTATFDIRDKTSCIFGSSKFNHSELINRINYTAKVLEAAT